MIQYTHYWCLYLCICVYGMTVRLSFYFIFILNDSCILISVFVFYDGMTKFSFVCMEWISFSMCLCVRNGSHDPYLTGCCKCCCLMLLIAVLIIGASLGLFSAFFPYPSHASCRVDWLVEITPSRYSTEEGAGHLASRKIPIPPIMHETVPSFGTPRLIVSWHSLEEFLALHYANKCPPLP